MTSYDYFRLFEAVSGQLYLLNPIESYWILLNPIDLSTKNDKELSIPR